VNRANARGDANRADLYVVADADNAGHYGAGDNGTLLNRVGVELAKDPVVHAVTDVTGFGLLGHSLGMARGSKVAFIVRLDELPLLSAAADLAQQHFATGASARNWASYVGSISLPSDFPDWGHDLLTDPQTSGGLLIACEPDRAAEITRMIVDGGYPHARIIGRAEAGPPSITIRS